MHDGKVIENHLDIQNGEMVIDMLDTSDRLGRDIVVTLKYDTTYSVFLTPKDEIALEPVVSGIDSYELILNAIKGLGIYVTPLWSFQQFRWYNSYELAQARTRVEPVGGKRHRNILFQKFDARTCNLHSISTSYFPENKKVRDVVYQYESGRWTAELKDFGFSRTESIPEILGWLGGTLAKLAKEARER